MAAAEYGHHHKAERARWQPVVDQGEAWCSELVCLMGDRWIQPGTAWDLAHDRTTGDYLGPAHSRCNRAEGGRHKHVRAKTRRRWAL